jgi:hypothetical protein
MNYSGFNEALNRYHTFRSMRLVRRPTRGIGVIFLELKPLPSDHFLTAPRGVLLLRTRFTFTRFFLETGCTDVETQTHPRVLGL